MRKNFKIFIHSQADRLHNNGQNVIINYRVGILPVIIFGENTLDKGEHFQFSKNATNFGLPAPNLCVNKIPN